MQRGTQFRKATHVLLIVPSTVKQAMARLEKLGDGHIGSSVLLLEPNTPNTLRDCITSQLTAAQLPRYQPWDPPLLTFNFAK